MAKSSKILNYADNFWWNLGLAGLTFSGAPEATVIINKFYLEILGSTLMEWEEWDSIDEGV